MPISAVTVIGVIRTRQSPLWSKKNKMLPITFGSLELATSILLGLVAVSTLKFSIEPSTFTVLLVLWPCANFIATAALVMSQLRLE
jgi:hypothetical protein